MHSLIRFMSIGCILLAVSTVHAQGYRLVGKRFEIRTAEEWNAWTLPEGAVEILPEGGVRPAFFRRNTNAVADAQEFSHLVPPLFHPEFAVLAGKSPEELGPNPRVSGGIKNAGSNLEDGVNVMDGDMHTYWQPDPSDVLKRWWIEIDLGRLVSATRIVLRFVEEGEGDPFLQFKVYVSKGVVSYYGAERMGWRQVYRSEGRNYDQRVVEMELGPELPVKMEGEGALVQYVRVVVLDTRGERAEIVSKEEYASLAQEFRGPLVYHRRTPFGEKGDREISWEGYETLPEEERGRIEYYRKELPRLAEVEVWTLGDNLALGIGKRGGAVRSSRTQKIIGDEEVDGAYASYRRLGGHALSTSLLVDLGCSFWVNMTRLIGMSEEKLISYRIRSYEIERSDGTRAPEGGLLWRSLTRDSRMDLEWWSDLPVRTEDRFDLHKIRFFNLQFPTVFIRPEYRDPSGNPAFGTPPVLYLSEFQVYGEGYVADASLTSPPIEAGWSKALGQIRWEGETLPGTNIEIQTRSGMEVEMVRRFLDKDGQEITEQEWRELPFLFQGPVTIDAQPTRWSGWSTPYKESGEWVTSPTPSPFFQVRVRLLSDDPHTYPSIRSVSVDHFDPLVRRVVGEIVPYRVLQAGEEYAYSCFLRCLYDSRNVGFDGIVLRCAYPMDVTLLNVRRGTEEEFASGNAPELLKGDFTLLPTGSDSIWIRLPDLVKPVRHTVFEIRFAAKVFLKGTSFEVLLVNSEQPRARQRVLCGDAAGFVESEEMRVMVPVDARAIGDVQVAPDPFTPNGDGINDEAEIGFSVFNVDGTRDVYVEILDLGGWIVRRLSDIRENVSGSHRLKWDGRDEDGARVSPGVYVVRICVDADSRLVAKDRVVVRTVGVVY